MNIFITGIGGFLGGRLMRYWAAAGHSVSGTIRRSSKAGVPEGCRAIPFALGDSLPAQALERCDAVVHCAYDRQAGAAMNIGTTNALCLAAEEACVPYQLFVSSYASRPESRAEYGLMKYRLETFFLQRGHAVVRPGLVIGNGGLFGRTLSKILHAPVIPLLDGGRDLIAVIAVEDFLKAMDVLVLDRRAGVFNLFNRELIPMRTLVDAVNGAAQHRALRVRVPLGVALRLLRLTGKMRIRLPVDVDNIRSLKQSPPGVHESDLETIVPHPCSFETMIAAAVDGIRRREN